MESATENKELMDLVVRISEGSIVENNMSSFKEYALSLVKPADKDLVTAQDLTEAKDAIKLCELIEIRVSNAITSVQHKPDVQTALNELEKFREQVRQIRLKGTKRIDKKVADDKERTVDDGYNQIKAIWEASPAKHGINISRSIFSTAIKGKSSEKSLDKAIASTLESEKKRIQDIEDNYQYNFGAVTSSEIDYPTSYPDKRTICLQPADVVTQMIETRETKAKLAAAEAKERAEKAAKEKAEREAAEKPAEERLLAEEKDREVLTTVAQSISAFSSPPDPFSEGFKDEPIFTMPPTGGFTPPGPKKQVILVRLEIQSDSISMIMKRIQEIPGVKQAAYQIA